MYIHTTMNAPSQIEINTQPQRKRLSLLRDYSKCAADTDDVSISRSRRLAHNTSSASTTCSSILPPPESPEADHQVTFQLRRYIVNRQHFMGYLKNHYSTSALDLKRAPLIGKSCRPNSIARNGTSNSDKKMDRRETLKKALRKTQSLRHLDVDTSPLSSSVHEQSLKMPVPKSLMSRSLHGSLDHEASPPQQRNGNPSMARVNRRRATPMRTLSGDSTGSRLKAMLSAGTEDRPNSYLPPPISECCIPPRSQDEIHEHG